MQTPVLQLYEILTLNGMKIEASFKVEQMLYYDLTKSYVRHRTSYKPEINVFSMTFIWYNSIT